MKLLCIDVGNTSVHAARVEGGRVGRRWRAATSECARPAALRQLTRLGRGADAAVIASVVPAVGARLRRELPHAGIKAALLGRDVPVPIRNRYRRPGQVGIDRLVNAVAAYDERPQAAVIVDFGTAITFDALSARGEYLGGIIAPGIEISLDALAARTALLPKIRLAHPRHAVGRDTVESIRLGCTVGIGGLCDRVIERLKRRLGRRVRVVATGGYARFIARYCRGFDRIDEDLTVRGVYISYCKSVTYNF